MSYYVCPTCGNVIEKVVDTKIPVHCCGQEMRELMCGEFPELKAKHVPIASYNNGILTIRVGMQEHPMLENHHIDFISIDYDNRHYRYKLQIGTKPEVSFHITDYHGIITIKAYCNIHGLWCSNFYLD